LYPRANWIWVSRARSPSARRSNSCHCRRLWDGLQAARNRLHHANLHQVVGHGVARLNAPVRHAHGGQCGADLVGDLLAMRQGDGAVTLRRGIRHDVCELDRFAAACWQYMQDTTASRERFPDPGHVFDLIVA
jgi:hypothetical protein